MSFAHYKNSGNHFKAKLIFEMSVYVYILNIFSMYSFLCVIQIQKQNAEHFL